MPGWKRGPLELRAAAALCLVGQQSGAAPTLGAWSERRACPQPARRGLFLRGQVLLEKSLTRGQRDTPHAGGPTDALGSPAAAGPLPGLLLPCSPAGRGIDRAVWSGAAQRKHRPASSCSAAQLPEPSTCPSRSPGLFHHHHTLNLWAV